jgi:ATPase subunit of ABC transporter with duplicated ATPase domains
MSEVNGLTNALAGKETADSGYYKWGKTINPTYLPQNNDEFFVGCDLSLVDWLSRFSYDHYEEFVRGWLGRMLFSGEEALKKASVISGGEKVRCMLAKMMLEAGNFMVLDEPTNHLDLESIQAFNNTLKTFKGNILLSSHDREFVSTVCNRIIELTPNGIIDKYMDFDEYLTSDEIHALREKMYE